ncbi:hypothetical protein BDW59DRAFT_165186 [Aspergillus cavernicola]|uniref:Uncharacterized protein n=1 Tax=Aspergillus cavernicola TaxID=176166 RepID=A0ABR4HUF1_9EURO
MTIALLLLTAAFASVATAQQRMEYICETSDGSPYLHNINELIDNLRADDKSPPVCNFATNGCGETVRQWSGEGGAVFMVCGSAMRCSASPQGLGCSGYGCNGRPVKGLANYLEDIRDECKGKDSNGDERAGGSVRFVFESDGRLVSELKLFSAPG